MKMSNLALRLDTGEPDIPVPPADDPADEALAMVAGRLAHTRGLGLEYRAIEIRDDGLRPFRVR
jgi:hypothetical protein